MHSVGGLRKMLTSHVDGQVYYRLVVGGDEIELNPLIGQTISIHYRDQINCVACGRKTAKSYSQGHCYPCSQSLARCDLCIMKPETCHYHLGTCREPQWGETHCFRSHTVYLANTSGIKVGITRNSQIPTRWMDQGATQAMPIFSVNNRLQSGLVEMRLKQHVADRTDWRKMLKGDGDQVDLRQQMSELLAVAGDSVAELVSKYGDDEITRLDTTEPLSFHYPVSIYPEKIKALNLDKTPSVTGVLQGIKGQYLILDCGVLNIRKYSGYQIEFRVKS